MIGFYARTFQSLNGAFWTIRVWLHVHPWWARILTVVALDLYIVVFGNTLMARADSGFASFLLDPSITDSSGVPLANYAKLPVDRGDMFSWQKAVVAMWLDPIWTGHIAALSWMIWFCNWLLTFEWVNVIAAPFGLVADLLKQFLGQTQWVAFALVISGGVAGIAMMVGKHAGGWSEVFISATCAVLATGMLANPIATLTMAGGALDQAKQYGGEIAAAVVSEDFTNTNLDSKNMLATAVSSQLVDIFVRVPSQSIAFGKAIEGECATIFTDTMIASAPAFSDGDEVRKGVDACDAEAKKNNENPGFGQVVTAATLSTSNFTILGFPIIAGILFLITVIGFLISAMKAMWHVYLGILPVNRYPLWRALGDTVMGLVAIMAMAVVMAAILKIVVAAVTGIANLGLPLVGQSLFMDMVLVVVLVMMWRTRRAAKKAGRTMAEQLSRYGLGRGGQHGREAGHKAVAAMGAISMVAASALRRPDRTVDARSINTFAAPVSAKPGPGLEDIGPLRPVPGGPAGGGPGGRPGGPGGPRALPGPQGSTGGPQALPAGPSTQRKLAGAALTAVRIARGAKAGVPGVIAAAALEGSSAVVRAVGNHAAEAKQQEQQAYEAPRETSHPTIVVRESPRLVVAADGTAHVNPQTPAPQVYDITTMPHAPAPSARSQAVRDMLSTTGR